MRLLRQENVSTARKNRPDTSCLVEVWAIFYDSHGSVAPIETKAIGTRDERKLWTTHHLFQTHEENAVALMPKITWLTQNSVPIDYIFLTPAHNSLEE